MMAGTARLTLAALLLLCLPAPLHGEQLQGADTTAPASLPRDSSSAVIGASAHTLVPARTDTGQFRPRRSPGLAMLLSAVVPGAGQAYCESYWKVPVFVGFGIYFGSEWVSSNRKYLDYRDRYKASLQQSANGDSYLLSLRDFYKSQRDTFTWYFLILYVINIADAYVDASLYDFDVSPDLSIRLAPVPSSHPAGGGSLGIRIRF